jgi:hypothetical protein
MYVHADDQELFTKGCAAYEEQQYAGAQEQFLAIAEKSPAVWYNAGNAAYHQQAYGYAVLYWLRAARTTDATLYRDSMQNSAYVRTYLGQEISVAERVHYYCKLITCYMPLLWLQLLLIGLWIGMVWLNKRKLLRRWFLLCISLLSIMIVLLTLICRPEKNRAVIVAQQASVYAGPNGSFYQLATLKQARIVTLISSKPAWDKISYDGQVGWVAHEQIEFIDTV